MNRYIENMKNAVASYKQAKETANERIKAIYETYGQEAGDREKAMQEKKLAPQAEATRQAIREAHKSGVNAVEQWAKLDGSKLTDDARLLDAGLVDEKEFERLKTKYSDNSTMLLALRKYGEKQNEMQMQASREDGHVALTEGYKVRDIPTAESKMHNWELAQKQAMHMVDLLDKSGDSKPGNWGNSFELAFLPEQLEHFGEGKDF